MESEISQLAAGSLTLLRFVSGGRLGIFDGFCWFWPLLVGVMTLVVVTTGLFVVVTAGLLLFPEDPEDPGTHWEYQSFNLLHVLPLAQHLAPDQPLLLFFFM